MLVPDMIPRTSSAFMGAMEFPQGWRGEDREDQNIHDRVWSLTNACLILLEIKIHIYFR